MCIYFLCCLICLADIAFIRLFGLLFNAIGVFREAFLRGRRLKIELPTLCNFQRHILNSLLLLQRLAFLPPKGCRLYAAPCSLLSRLLLYWASINNGVAIDGLEVVADLLMENTAVLLIVDEGLLYLLYSGHARSVEAAQAILAVLIHRPCVREGTRRDLMRNAKFNLYSILLYLISRHKIKYKIPISQCIHWGPHHYLN